MKRLLLSNKHIVNKGGYISDNPPKKTTPPGLRNAQTEYVPLKLNMDRLNKCKTDNEIWLFAVTATMQIADYERTIDDLTKDVKRLKDLLETLSASKEL